jgi:uncharacterized delta-60 repeat protein
MKTNISYRNVFRLALPCACWALACTVTACGDDEGSTPDDDAGSGGSAAGESSGGSDAGGKASAGSSNGGKASAGTAGGGTAGKGSAGSAGEGGMALQPEGGEGGQDVGPGGSDAGGAGGETGGPPTNDAVQIIDASPTGHDRFYGTAFDAAGNIYAIGQITSSNDATADIATLIAKFTPAGVLDTSFGAGGFYVRNVVNGTSGELFRNIVVQSSGKLVAVGTVEHVGGADARDRDIALIRVNADGTKDTTFGADGVVKLDLSTGVANGNSFLADSAWGLARYDNDRLAISGGKVRDGGLDTNFVLARLSADGVPDETFGTHGVSELDTGVEGVEHNNASPRDITLLPGTDGLVGGGYQPKPGANTSPVVYKVTDAGVLDDTFGDHGVFHTAVLDEQTECYAAVVQPLAAGGYKLVTTGYGRQLATETTDFVSLRLTSSGQLDPSYGTAGVVRLDIGGFGDNSRKLMVLPDRRILLLGGGRLTSANVDGIVAVLGIDGAPDTTFAPGGFKVFDLGGPADFLWGAALSPNQQTLAIGGIRGVGNAPMPASAADDAALLLLPVP